MKIRKQISRIVLISFALWSGIASAEPQELSVPGEGWKIKLETSPLKPLDGGVKTAIFHGLSGDDVVISFFVDSPKCKGGDSNESLYYCFQTYLKKNPFVIWDSERGNTVENGVLVMYFGQLPNRQGVPTDINMNLLFAHKGKWADLHISLPIRSRDKEAVSKQIDLLSKILASVRVVDE